MASTTMTKPANSPPLKRSFSPDLLSNHPLRTKRPGAPSTTLLQLAPPTSSHRTESLTARQQQRLDRFRQRRRSVNSTSASMPVQTAQRGINVPMPTFMSVFGEEANNGIANYSDKNNSNHGDSITQGNTLRNGVSSTASPFSHFHQHRDSTSTSASESTDSSPTTTISTLDSASMTEPSPGPSPESPATKQSPSASFVPDLRSRNVLVSNGGSNQTPFFELQRPMTPAKKPRNLKNLHLNFSGSLSLERPVTAPGLPLLAKNELTTSAPASPSFVKPPTPPQRNPKAPNLPKLRIAGNSTNINLPTRLSIPSTPSFKPPVLRHFQSSPQLPLLSPSVAPQGGMQLPPLRTFKPSPHGFAEVPMEDEEEEQEPNFDIPQSREEKPASYPNGPICIYESGVYLYYEPTAEQASNYDVILNVASEVKNPFSVTIDEANEASKLDLDEKRSHSEPASTVDTVPADFAITAFGGVSGKTDTQTEQSNTPTTPKATKPLENDLRIPDMLMRPSTSNRPEYIHIPWEHNTDIVPDLYKLVKVVEDRVQRKKRVLVHCQCGVSRSASLIVAYGLYKNPGISVQEAYDAVKKRSKWIGPNMNLIMQLQEFRSGLLRANGDRSFHQQVYGMPSRKLSPSFGNDRRNSPYQPDLTSGSRTPQTAPLPPEPSMDSSSQRASTGNMENLSPPLTAPSGLWSPGFRRSWGATSSDYSVPNPPASCPHTPMESHSLPGADTSTPSLQKPDNTKENSVESHKLESNQRLGTQVVSIQPSPPEDVQMTDPPPIGKRSPLRVPNFSRPRRLPDADTEMLDSAPPPLFSPRSEHFHMVGIQREQPEDAFGILSPHNTFNTEAQQPSGVSRVDDTFGLMSPGLTGGFPQDPFARREEPAPMEISSPRASEFHMTALRPSKTFNDSFGLTSPRNVEHSQSFIEAPTSFFDLEQLKKEPHTVLPQHVHAILPPPSDTTTTGPSAGYPFPDINSTMEMPVPSQAQDNVESSSNTPTPKQSLPQLKPILVEPSASRPSEEQETSNIPPIPPPPSEPKRHDFLGAPPPAQNLRGRFSSPNLSQQIRLHKLQTEMEAKLPNRTSTILQAQDDLDALMSPRATEFTRNPFHMDFDAKIQPSRENVAPALVGFDVPELPAAAKDDPRSPATKGSSPIVRNIWDVL